MPCLWLRGILPIQFDQVSKDGIQETLVASPVNEHNYPGNVWLEGVYFTDASGGSNAKFPSLRRVAFSIAVLDSSCDDPCLSWGLHSPLPGVIQTVPRGDML